MLVVPSYLIKQVRSKMKPHITRASFRAKSFGSALVMCGFYCTVHVIPLG
ncbi:hypothetical protein SAMN05660706_1467 [Desulfoscipio geothermicus DSM 3669]|uniref:Uncharacterized protein n=1 Tax=Desulfoscipio geothermicus DSM 3669 TaxID=1121426 RepID=A0A1I6EIN0_9FIRM|nr:hypothetical protein SAMN05660706_1467 [Desulfoscipio geothermicus DSM 3669]